MRRIERHQDHTDGARSGFMGLPIYTIVFLEYAGTSSVAFYVLDFEK